MSCSKKLLNKHLADFYAQHILAGKAAKVAAKPLRDAVQINPDLAAEAQLRLQELTQLDNSSGGNIARRCYVSSIQKTGLEEALNG